MKISKAELVAVLAQFNPWWENRRNLDLPNWRRAIFDTLFEWVYHPPVRRAVLLSGARQVGNTTLQLQVIAELLKKNVPASNILYATFDHPLIKLAGIEFVISAWRSREPKAAGSEYLFLDEAQFIRDWGIWIKHQVDFNKERRIVFTGSAMPLLHKEQESGVGRWHTIRLATLSFYEYLQLKKYSITNLEKMHFSSQLDKISANLDYTALLQNLLNPKSLYEELSSQYPLPKLKSLYELFEWPPEKFYQVSKLIEPYLGHFHDYLVRGGFPQTVQIKDIGKVQDLLREDIIDKILKRDMTTLFGVRRVIDLEQTFLYLCMHDGGLLEMKNLCENLEVKRPTATHFIELLEAAHLIYRLQPYGYGKEILRAKYKIYLADAAIGPAVLLKGKTILDNATELGIAVETTVFKHLFVGLRTQNIRLTYWKGAQHHEVDLIAESNNQTIPFEIKYRAKHTGSRELKGLRELCQKKKIKYGYVITKTLEDFGLSDLPESNTRIIRIPAVLLCYWIGEAEYLLKSNSGGLLEQ